MLLLCDESVILPLHIISTNIWKLASVAPIFKMGNKQLINKYKPISLLPVCGKILEKIIFNNLYTYLHLSGFHPGDSTSNQLLYLLDEINQAFDSTESFEARTVFLDISSSRAIDNVWHDGLILLRLSK